MNLTTQGTQVKEKQIHNTINNGQPNEPDNIDTERDNIDNEPDNIGYTRQLIMYNPMNLTTQGTQDEEKQIHNTINNGQPNETGNIAQTRRRETKQKHNTIQRNWQHRVHKMERNKAKTQHNPEKMATQGRKDGEKVQKDTQ